MKVKYLIAIILGIAIMTVINTPEVMAQCSICSKVASDLGDNAAKGLNAGILYLLAFPLSFIGILGYRWYKSNMPEQEEE